MKYLHYITILLLAATSLFAQEIKLDKNIIYSGEFPVFNFEKKSMGNELHVYKLNTKEELFNITVDNNNTENKADDGKKISFINQNIIILSKNFRTQKWDFIISLLFQEKVIDTKGNIDSDNLKRFKSKYDDNNVNQTMR